jgi:integrase
MTAAINRTWSLAHVHRDCASWPDPQERTTWLAKFGDEHSPRPWVRESAYDKARVYSRYFETTGETVLTMQGMRVFIRLCELGGCCPRTLAGYAAAIFCVLRLLHPENSCQWLYRRVLAMQKAAAATPKKRAAAIHDALDLCKFAMELIEKGRAAGRKTDRGRDLFGTGLYIIIAVHCPERLRALTSIDLDQIDLDQRTITFRPDQTKGKVEAQRELHENLIPIIREWIKDFRGDHPHRRLWATRTGSAPVPATIYAALRRHSKKFEVPITSHPIRNAAASFIMREAPDKARLVGAILWHKSGSPATEEYIMGAGMIEASRTAGTLLQNVGKRPENSRRRRRRRAHFSRPNGAGISGASVAPAGGRPTSASLPDAF